MTKTKSIVVTLIALLVLSMFSGFAEAGRSRKMLVDSSTESGIAGIVETSQTVEDKNRGYNIGEINSCLDAKLKRGDRASFVFEDNQYSIRQGLVGDRYTQLSFQGADSRFYSGDAKRYDTDLDGQDDVQIAVYDLLNGNAFLSICGLEDKQESQDVAVEASEVSQDQETISFLDTAFTKIRSWFN